MSRPAGPSIRELLLKTQQNICKYLDVSSPTGGDFRTLAANVGMSIPDLDIVAQGKQPTHSVLSWWGRRNEATIPKLREILISMGRWDCVGVLDQDPKTVRPPNESQGKVEQSKRSRRKRLELKEFEIGDLSPMVYNNLCDAINEKNSGRDYIALATRMKYTADDLRKFERSNSGNPTDEILQNWKTKVGHNLEKLIRILRKIERDDLAEMLGKECFNDDDSDEDI